MPSMAEKLLDRSIVSVLLLIVGPWLASKDIHLSPMGAQVLAGAICILGFGAYHYAKAHWGTKSALLRLSDDQVATIVTSVLTKLAMQAPDGAPANPTQNPPARPASPAGVHQ